MVLFFSPNRASVALGLFVAVTSQRAQAQTDSAAARQLFDEGRALVAQQKYAEACPRFEQSYQRDPGIGTLFNLADCWQHLGRTASAWAKFRDVADEAVRTNQPERERVALKRAAELLPQLSQVVVRVDSKDVDLEVRRDGIAILLADQGKPVALDPGEHRFDAKAPGKQSWSTTVVVPPQGKTVEIVVPALEDVAPRSTAVVTEPSGHHAAPSVVALGNSPMEPNKDAAAASWNRKYLAYAVGGVGVAGVALGSVFGFRVLSKNSQADSICPTGEDCSADDKTDFTRLIADAKRERTYAYVGFGVGGAALVTGTILYLTAPKPKTAALRFTPGVELGRWGATLEGTF